MKYSHTFIPPLLVLPLLIALSGCSNGNGGETNALPEGEESSLSPNELAVTHAQYKATGIKLGSADTMIFSHTVNANGYVVVEPGARASVGVIVPGRVTSIEVLPGEVVKKGQLLFAIEGNEIVELQVDYAEAASQLMMAEETFNRQKTLSEENISAKKEFTAAESNYKVLKSKVAGLKQKLKLLGLDPGKVLNSEIVREIKVYSPIEGTVSSTDLVIGKGVEPFDELIEIVDTKHLQLHFEAFAKDIGVLKPGQHIKYYNPDQPGMKFNALLSHVGNSIDRDSRTIECVAKTEVKDQPYLVDRLFVEVIVYTSERETLALPETAFSQDGDQYYVFHRTGEDSLNVFFSKIPVKTGMVHEGKIEVFDPDLSDIIIDGTYFLTD